MRKEYRQTSAVWLGVLIVFVSAIVVQILVSLVLGHTLPGSLENPSVKILLSTLPMYLVGIPLAVLIFRFADSMPPAQRMRIRPLTFFAILSICFALALVGSLFGQAVNNGIYALTGKEQTNPVTEVTSGVPLWLNLLVVAVCAPIAEEFLYRKLVIDHLKRYGDLVAVAVSALVFGAIHANFSQFFYAVFLGAVFGAVYCMTGKLRYTICFHIIFNAVGTLSGEFIGRVGTDLTVRGLFLHPETIVWLLILGLLYLVSIVCAPFAFHAILPKFQPEPGVARLSRKQALFVTFLNPAFWALFVMIVYLFLS